MALLTNDGLTLEVCPFSSGHGWITYTVRFLFNGQSIISPGVIRRNAEYRLMQPGYMMAVEEDGCTLPALLDTALEGMMSYGPVTNRILF